MVSAQQRTYTPRQISQMFYDQALSDMLDPESRLNQLLEREMMTFIELELPLADRPALAELRTQAEGLQAVIAYAAERIERFEERLREVLLTRLGQLESETLKDIAEHTSLMRQG